MTLAEARIARDHAEREWRKAVTRLVECDSMERRVAELLARKRADDAVRRMNRLAVRKYGRFA